MCNDPDMTLPPASVPSDTSRLRLERTAIRRVPGEAFRPLGRLEQLWLPYNALSEFSARTLRGLRRLRELRLPGNRLAAFPWAALSDAPQLRLLDLQANRLSGVPPEAALFLGNLTFLDLSSNQLMRLPQVLLAAWAHLQTEPFLPGHHARLVLGKTWHPSLGTTLVSPGVLRKLLRLFEFQLFIWKIEIMPALCVSVKFEGEAHTGSFSSSSSQSDCSSNPRSASYCVSLGKLLHFSGPLLPYVKRG